MTLRRLPRELAPKNCGECEFSCDVSDAVNGMLVLCVRENKQHNKGQGLCPWYCKTSEEEMLEMMGAIVPLWMEANIIWRMYPGSDLGTIAYNLMGIKSEDYARVREEKDEK